MKKEEEPPSNGMHAYICYIPPELRIGCLPFLFLEGSMAALEGAPREHGGNRREQGGVGGSRGEQQRGRILFGLLLYFGYNHFAVHFKQGCRLNTATSFEYRPMNGSF